MTPQPQVHCARQLVGAIAMAILLGLTGARAQVFELSPEMPVQAPISFIKVLEESDGKLDASLVRHGKYDNLFQPLSGSKTSLGVSSSAWWVRFEVRNPTQKPIWWVMNFPLPMVDKLDASVHEKGKKTRYYWLGDKRPLSLRQLPGEGYAISINTEAGGTTKVYVRLKNLLGDGMDTYFEVSSTRAYVANQLKIWLFLGFILGGGVVLFFYNAVVCFVVREWLYVWYLLYLFFVMLTFVAASGLGLQFLWSNTGIISEAMPPLASALALICVVQFSRSFLGTEDGWPKIDRFLQACIVYFTLPPIAFFAGYGGVAAGMIMVGSLTLTVLPVLGFYVGLSGQRTAFIFALGWTCWFLSLCSISSRIIGLLPTNDFTLRVGWVGILLEAVLFALALAYRIQLLRKEKAAAEERERAVLQRSKDDLEAMVRERTRELAVQHEELRRLNDEKDRLFSIVAHDLRNPISGVIGLSDILRSKIHEMSREEVDEYLRDLQESAEGFHKLLENLLSWAMLQLGGVRFSPQTVDLPELVQRCVDLFAQTAEDKKVHIETTGIAVTSLVADPQMLETIVRNLLGNAIKYSREGGSVSLTSRRNGESVEIAIADQGVGMNEQKVAGLFNLGARNSTPGTHGEPGTGLGLHLCRELTELHGGKLTVESKPDEGTTFRLSLPQPAVSASN